MTDRQAKFFTLRRLFVPQTAEIRKFTWKKMGESKWKPCWRVVYYPMERRYHYTRQYFRLLRTAKAFCQSNGYRWEIVR